MSEENKINNVPGGELGKDAKLNESKEKTVQVKQSVLESILKKVEGMEDENKTLRGKLDMLESVADKGRVAVYLAKNSRGELIRTASAWKWRDKFVVATVTERNESHVDQYGRQVVDQVLKIVFDDGSDTEYSYSQFSKEKRLVKGEVIKRASDETGDFWTLKFADGKSMAFNLLFLN